MRFKGLILLLVVVFTSCKSDIKEPSVAGAFYPESVNTLKSMVDDFLMKAEDKPVEGRLIAIISPHAGYVFSGHVAAWGYKQLKDSNVKTVVLIGSSHYHSFVGASVYTKGGFKTPLGIIKIDKKIAKNLINESADVGFYQGVYEKEHSIEVQLPFLQRVLRDFKIVPILMGAPTRKSFEHLKERLIKLMSQDKHIILIVSTDLSHYYDYETAVKMDGKLISALQRLSTGDAEGLLMRGEAEMCGAYPVMLTMEVARRLGANIGVLYKYANSGDVTSEKGRVVGYASMGLYKSPLTKEEKEELLSLAKRSIIEYITRRKVIDVDMKNPKLIADGATFVTITRGGHLRGCIGNIQPIMPLYKSVIRSSISASCTDPRFPPMNKKELEDMNIEISILSPFEILKDVRSIEIGRDGLYIMKDGLSGILLPQVAKEQGWDKETFLREVSLKAGLPEDAWKNGATLYRFSAEIIKKAQ